VSTYILWDIDGTLIYNNPQGGGLYVKAITAVTGSAPTERVPDPHGMTEGQLLAALLEVNGHDTALLGDVLVHLDRLSLDQHNAGSNPREACRGTTDAIAAFASLGWTNALLTGNGPNRSRYKLLAAGYDLDAFDWEHSYFGHEQPTRHHLTAGARDDLVGHHAVIIGDTPNDGLAADSAGIPFVAVATGAYSASELRQTSAILVIDDLENGLDAATAAISTAIGVPAR
jgi:phosphoglycolate phosphatase-like HAD superfamily hydrolase